MNPLDYASLEASKRLVDAGIVLETEVYWRIYGLDEDPVIELVLAEHRLDGWDRCNLSIYPAPSMAEVWRELPSGTELYKQPDQYVALFNKRFTNTNPTDALIDLLIWVRKEVNNGTGKKE